MVTFSILCSMKFSLVQFFTELPSRRSEEIFAVLNFVPTLEQDPHQSAVLKNFAVTVVFLHGNRTIRKKLRNSAPCENFPL